LPHKAIIGFGDYEEGDLWIHKLPSSVAAQQANTSVSSSSSSLSSLSTPPSSSSSSSSSTNNYAHEVGDAVGSYSLSKEGGFQNIKNKFVIFDGHSPHYTTKFSGNRYTAVFYTRKHWEKADPQSKEILRYR